MRYRIALSVHGRFHMFDLGRELLARGHDVHLFTNYPRFVVRRFGIPSERVHSFVAHGVTTRLCTRVLPARAGGLLERVSNVAFARWAARVIPRQQWDVVFSMSGIAENLFEALADRHTTLRVLHRGSSHIRTQRRLLEEEERRAGRWIEKPSDWIVAREEREYELADVIHVLSEFARRSFVEEGILAARLYMLRLGVRLKNFQPLTAVIDERWRRIRSGAPLRVLSVGTFCCRKGALDLRDAVRQLHAGPYSFRFVGPVAPDARALAADIATMATFTGKRPQAELPRDYEWGDLFLLPTIEDGFAVVLTQALASGLPLVVTPNCAGPDLIREGEQGWMLPIRSPAAIVERLQWCHDHRDGLAEMVKKVYESSHAFDWKQTAEMAEHNVTIGRERTGRISSSDLRENKT
jgi:glycosyltransferase involved in cell wall biosynthesis